MIKVINKREASSFKDGTIMYIGRGSALGNPFAMKDGSQAERDRVCNEYETWIKSRINFKDRAVCNQLNEIYRCALSGNVYLMCYCKPMRCHGDTVKRIVDKKLAQGGYAI